MVDHDTLDEAIDAIDLLIRHGQYDRLREVAESFAAMLEEHFALEEQSTMFTKLCGQSLANAETIRKLLDEHQEMRVEVRALLECDDLAPRLMALTKRLDEHEKIELELVEHAFARVTHE